MGKVSYPQGQLCTVGNKSCDSSGLLEENFPRAAYKLPGRTAVHVKKSIINHYWLLYIHGPS